MTPAEKRQLAKDYAEQVSFQSTIELDAEQKTAIADHFLAGLTNGIEIERRENELQSW